MELVFVWLEVLPNYLDEFYAAQANPALICVCKRAAVARLGPELLEALSRILGCSPRCSKLFEAFKDMPAE